MTLGPPKSAPSPAALRMRRSRERCQRRSALVSLEVPQRVIADLVSLGWLSPPDQGDKSAIVRALNGLIVRAVRARVTPLTGPEDKSFLCSIKRTTIETLIETGWLRGDQQDDPSAIAKAFRRFAGRALSVARNGGPGQWFFP
jgi:hypothetical protein